MNAACATSIIAIAVDEQLLVLHDLVSRLGLNVNYGVISFIGAARSLTRPGIHLHRTLLRKILSDRHGYLLFHLVLIGNCFLKKNGAHIHLVIRNGTAGL